MRYLLVFLPLFFLSIPSLIAQNTREPLIEYRSSYKSTVTTRTGGSVTTRSSDVTKKKQGDTAKKDTTSQKAKSKKQKNSKSQAKAESGNDITTAKGMLNEEAVSYRKEARRLQAAGDLDGAFKYYQKATELDPYNIETINDLGVVYEGLGDTITAVEMYKKALEINPSYLPSYTNLAFLYESKNDTQNATYYWRKRYELGVPGDYWRETARKHLMRLGTYPEVQKEMIDKEVAMLSRDFAEKRMERKEQAIEDAKMHFNLGARLYAKKDYNAALKEFEAALSLNPADDQLKAKIMDFYKKSERASARDMSLAETQGALKDIKNDDYQAAAKKLRSALSTVFRVTQEK
ncbi:MAG: tetratricopeptide repeat protein [Candidatus Omnitrophota bacterium]|jgi:tetratricopeptide (TPR) repeat protein